VSELELKAQNASSIIPPAELHGLVCGFAAGAPEAFSMTEFVQLAGVDVLSDEQAVGEFVSSTLDELFSQDMEFAPLIPDDNEALGARMASLAEWCAGFLSGFGASTTIGERETLHVDVQEILRDFASISALEDDVGGDEQDESSFMEIFEYVRVAAVLTIALIGDGEQAGEEELEP